MIFDIISTFTSLIPFIDIGKIKVEFIDVDVQFYKPIAGRPHWDEENYSNEPLKYRICCKVNIYNGKKETSGIRNCIIHLNECPAGWFDDKKEIDFSPFLNIPAKECREICIEKEETIFFAEHLKNGYSFSFNYIENGSRKMRNCLIKSVKS